MRGGVDAAGQAGDHDQAGRQVVGQGLGHVLAVGGGVAAADHGDRRRGEQGGVALHRDDRRGVVEIGQQRRVVGVANEDQPAAEFCGLLEFPFGVGGGWGRGGRRFPTRPGEQRESGQGRRGRAVAGEQAAPGDRSDALGPGKPQALDGVFGWHGLAPGGVGGAFAPGGEDWLKA